MTTGRIRLLWCTVAAVALSVSLKTAFAQETADELEKRIEELKVEQKTLETQLDEVRGELSSAERALQKLRARTLLESGATIEVTIAGTTGMFEKPTISSDQIAAIAKGETVVVLRAASSPCTRGAPQRGLA